MWQVVSGGLERLQYEKDSCVKYDPSQKQWMYLHGYRSEADFHHAEATAVASVSTPPTHGLEVELNWPFLILYYPIHVSHPHMPAYWTSRGWLQALEREEERRARVRPHRGVPTTEGYRLTWRLAVCVAPCCV